MTIIVYKCTVCNREIEILENINGLETVGRCIITDGCRGTLYQIDKKQDFVRGKFPAAVAGLTDWSQRKVLHNHAQPIATNQWKIEHNLGVNPSVQVFGDRPIGDNKIGLVEIVPDSTTIVDDNNLILTFSRAESGVAQSIARSSRPKITRVRVEEQAVVGIQPFQLTSTSELTIATLDDSTNNDITLTFTTPDARVIDLTYNVDDVASINSSWTDFNKIFFHGKSYTVRSLNIIGKVELTDGTVIDSSSIYFKSIKTPNDVVARALTTEEVIILLADNPYAIQDKIIDRFIDPTPIDVELAAFSFYYTNNEIYGYDNLIKTVFPHIREA